MLLLQVQLEFLQFLSALVILIPCGVDPKPPNLAAYPVIYSISQKTAEKNVASRKTAIKNDRFSCRNFRILAVVCRWS